MEDVFKVETEILVTDKLLKFDLTQDKLPEFRKLIQKLDKGQVDRIKKNIDSTKNSLLFLEVISDCENIMTHSVNLTNALKNNLIASKKTDENGNDEEEN
jgi:Na+/phosphate symporter